ncbi:MAG: mannose-1-phosphate guanylyltransferase [Bacteroidales bacterium]|nr:mannose-1-phosphate guanylyltransferase [Bacteroidales bacterium]
MKQNKNNNHYCVIMAGGIGSRFWPLSRTEKPKQFVDILGVGRTFIQMTFDRFAPFIPKENFVVVTGEVYKELVLEQLPELTEEQVLLEPARRNTAPCLAYAAYKLKKKNPDAVMVVTPADHLILDTATFSEVMQEGLRHAEENNYLLTIGITPSFPSTGYGYIEVEDTEETFSKVTEFKEKPDYDTAVEFIESGDYRWNSGMFIWSVKAIDAALRAHLPTVSELFRSAEQYYYTPDEQKNVNEVYLASESISIDYGIMEKADNVYVRSADFGWSDLGTWTSLYEQSTKDERDNVLSGDDILATDTTNCLVKQLNDGKRVVVDGVKDLLVVDTEDVLLICDRRDEDQVKAVIDFATK